MMRNGSANVTYIRKMNDSIEAPKSTLYSMRKSLSFIAGLSVTWWRSKDNCEVICKEYRTSKDIEASIQGFGSVFTTESPTEFSESLSNIKNLPLHYENIKLSLIELRKLSLSSSQFYYPDDIEWQTISTDNIKDRFKEANQIELNIAFLWAAFIKRWDLLPEFLKLGAYLNYYEPNCGLSALHLAAFSGCKEGTEFLLSQDGSDANAMHKCYTPLHCSAFGDSPETAKVLLEKGAYVDALTNDLHSSIESILHCAVRANALNCVKLFCDIGANINQLDCSGRTAIHLAAELGCTECLKILVKAKGANVNLQTTEKKQTALHLAAEGQHLDCIDILLENGASTHIINIRMETPLHLAAKVHSNDCVKILLKKGKANPNAQDVDDRTPLHVAVSKANRLNCTDVIKTLISYGADVNAKDIQFIRPLHLAAFNEMSESAETLIKFDADVTAKCKSGIMALSIIRQKVPTCIDAIRRKLDESISFTQPESTSKEFELKIDFSVILQYCHPKEITFIIALIREGQKELLLHPLCMSFLYLKWRKIRKFYIYRAILQFFFVIILSSYVLLGIAKNCYNVSKNVTDSSRGDDRNLCFNHTLLGKIIVRHPFLIELHWYILVVQCIGIFVRKLCSLPAYDSLKQYVFNLENFLDWGCVLTVFLISFVYTGRTYVWQSHVSAFGVLLGWINLLYILGQFPSFGTYVAMYTSVQAEFSKLLFVFSCLLIGFTISFCVLFPESDIFANVFIGYIAVLVMAIGEMNFHLIAERDISNHPFGLEGSMEIIYVLFVTCVTIVLINLLVGIAVHDIQGLKKSARLTKLIKQAKLIHLIEKAMLNDYFHRKIFLKVLKYNNLVSANGHGVLNVKAQHHGEKTLPKEILLAAFEVARKQRKRNKLIIKQINNPNKKKAQKLFKSDTNTFNFPDVNKISKELYELKNNLQNLNNEMVNIKYAFETNQKLMEQILSVVRTNKN